MLVLSRKVGETICIGQDIRVVVVEIRGDKIRLGIDAPKDITVHRQEVADAIARDRVLKDGSSPEASDPTPES
jgi:carbon storage regulator